MTRRVFLLGATGTIGQATARALLDAGHEVVCLVRPGREVPHGAEARFGDVTDPDSLRRDGLRGERFDVLVSCLASRTGAPKDAWAIDHQAHVEALQAAKEAGVTQVVVLSAICVQKPLLAFQQAKLAFEEALQASGLTYSIVRPTAFFKSLSGQVERLRAGKPFLVFGNGRLTACKPISDADLGRFLANCVTDQARWNQVLPIGGLGPALTPLDQGRLLFEALGLEPRFRHVPVGLLRGIAGGLALAGQVVPKLREKADLARIGLYYATESMLVWDPEAGRYDADATPEYGADTLPGHYARLARGEIGDQRGEHAVF